MLHISLGQAVGTSKIVGHHQPADKYEGNVYIYIQHVMPLDIDDTYTSNSLMFHSADRAICDVICNMTRV